MLYSFASYAWLSRVHTYARARARLACVMQVTPDSFVLVAGALTEVLVCFRPVTAGPKDIKVRVGVSQGAFVCEAGSVAVFVWPFGPPGRQWFMWQAATRAPLALRRWSFMRALRVRALRAQVHLVDVESRELVYALIVAAEAQGPLITR